MLNVTLQIYFGADFVVTDPIEIEIMKCNLLKMEYIVLVISEVC